MPAWVMAQLEIWKKIIEVPEKQAAADRSASCERRPRAKLIFGEGELTHELLAPRVDRSAAFRQRPPGGQLLWALSEREHERLSDDGWVRSLSTAIHVCAA